MVRFQLVESADSLLNKFGFPEVLEDVNWKLLPSLPISEQRSRGALRDR